jgi:hypothetical protein
MATIVCTCSADPLQMSFQAVKASWLKRVDSQLLQVLENFQSILNNCQVRSSVVQPVNLST